MHVYLNIETKPPPSSDPSHFYDKVKIDNRIKDEAKRLERITVKATEAYRAQSVKPFLAHVFVLTLLEDDGEPDILVELDERALVKALDTYIRETPEKIIWHTFNGVRFDHPLLRLRGMKYGAQNVVREMTTRKWGDEYHQDWFLKLGGEGSLDDLAAFFGISHPNPITGADVGERFMRGDTESVRLHTASRVLILRDLRARLGDLEIQPAETTPYDPDLPA